VVITVHDLLIAVLRVCSRFMYGNRYVDASKTTGAAARITASRQTYGNDFDRSRVSSAFKHHTVDVPKDRDEGDNDHHRSESATSGMLFTLTPGRKGWRIR